MQNKMRFIIPISVFLVMLLSVLLRFQVHKNTLSYPDGYFMDRETGVPYLTEMDSYYHLRMTKDILKYGHPGDTIKDGVFWDTISYAPDGRNTSTYRPLMAYIAIAVYKAAGIFAPVTVDQVVYWLNMFLSALVAIPVFLFTYEMCGFPGAIVASVLSVLNYGYFAHTVPGFFDTDGVITWVSCLFLYFGCKIIEKWDKNNLKPLILPLAGLILSFIALFNSWYVYYMFAGIFVMMLFVLAALSVKKGDLRPAGTPLIFSGVTALLILIFDPGIIKRVFSTIKGVFAGGGGLFPDIFVSISEMRKPSLWAGQFTGLFQMKVLSESNIGIINAVGGIVPFLGAFAMCVILIRRIVKKDIRPEYILLVIWYAVTLILAFRGWRFIMLFAVPVSILAGNLTGLICNLMDQGKMMDRNVYKVMLMILMLFPAVYGSFRSFGDSSPSAYADFGEAMTKIREKTDDDTKLISWWDYGYFFEEKTGRQTLFDGGSQSGMRSFFVAKALATKDEELSANIFKMLSDSGDRACEAMLETLGENKETLVLMEELLKGDKETALKTLEGKGIGEEKAAELSNLLFPDIEIKAECVITPDMSRISGWFASFGLDGNDSDTDSDEYGSLVDKMVIPSPGDGKTVLSAGGDMKLILEKEGDRYTSYTSFSEDKTPTQPCPVEKVRVLNVNGFYEFTSKDAVSEDKENDTKWTVIVEDDGTNAAISLVTTGMADSVFGKLFYVSGAGLEHFIPEPELSTSVRVYKLE